MIAGYCSCSWDFGLQGPHILLFWPLSPIITLWDSEASLMINLLQLLFTNWISMHGIARCWHDWSRGSYFLGETISMESSPVSVVSPGSLIHLLAWDSRQRQEQANNCVNSDLTNGGWPIPTHHPLHSSNGARGKWNPPQRSCNWILVAMY